MAGKQRPSPSQNAGKTDCLRGHPLSGKNLSIRRNGARVCKACQRLRQRESRVASNRWAARQRKQGLMRYGYNASVLRTTGRERLEQAFALIRETGRIKSADLVLGKWRRLAIAYFHPNVAALMHRIATEHKPAPARSAKAWRGCARTLLAQVREVVPRGLPKDQRDDVIAAIVEAVIAGHMRPDAIAQHVNQFVRARFRSDHNKFGPLSLDLPAFREGETPLIETISKGIWQ